MRYLMIHCLDESAVTSEEDDTAKAARQDLAVQALAKGELRQPSDIKLVGAGSVIGGRPVRRASAPAWMKG